MRSDSPAPGTYQEFGKLTSIEETVGVPEAMEMVRILVKGHEAVARTARKAFPAADKAGDESTADLLTQRLQVHEKDGVDASQLAAVSFEDRFSRVDAKKAGHVIVTGLFLLSP